MFQRFDRRQFLTGSTALAASLMLPTIGQADINTIPRSDFTEDSTADDVLAGLDLTGKTALITGVNSGIGYESMRALAKQGAHVIGAARTQEKAETACNSVEGKTTPVVCELTDFDSVVACTKTDKPPRAK